MVEWLSTVLYMEVNALFAAGIKLFPKRKREKMQETINWKCSNAGKTQSFTFWALTKIHPYCLRILKSTRDHICLKFWIFRFNLRKKKRTFANQTTENEIWRFWMSNSQLAQTEKVFTGLPHKKGMEARWKNAHKKHAGVMDRTDEGARYPVGTSGKNFLVAAHEKHVSKGFDRSG